MTPISSPQASALRNFRVRGRWRTTLRVAGRKTYDLYTRIPTVDGLLYESHQLDTDCVVLYQPTTPKTFTVVGKPVRVEDEPVRSMLLAEADKAAVVDFYDPEP